MTHNISSSIQSWVRKQPMPDKLLSELEGKMLQLQSIRPEERNYEEEKALHEKYNGSLHQINTYWLQRSRLRWSINGDLNTQFFHATVSSRRRRNMIHMLQLDDDSWTVDEKEIRRAFTNYFKNIYCEPKSTPPVWPEPVRVALQEKPKISVEHAAALEAIPMAEEIVE